MRPRIFAAGTVLVATAHAHEGYGMTGSPWHGGDGVGTWVLGAACLAFGLWLVRRT